MSTDEEVTNSDTEPSKDDLRERVRQLEQQLDAVTPDDVSRRAVLTGGGVGLASLLGGYYTGRAEAGSQSAGQIGTEANPADFWSEDNYIKSQSSDPAAPSSNNDLVFYNKNGVPYQRDGTGTITQFGGSANIAEELNGGNLVVVASGASPVTVDPSSTTTPVQDAIDDVAAASDGNTDGGAVLLPPGEITEGAGITVPNHVSIHGQGAYTTRLIIDSAGSTGMTFGAGGTSTDFGAYTDFTLSGNPSSFNTPPTTKATAIKHTGENNMQLWFDRICINGWYGTAIDMGTAGPYEIRHGNIRIRNLDSDGSSAVDLTSTGPARYFGTLAVYLRDDRSGSDGYAMFADAGDVIVEHLNIGGTAAGAISNTGSGTGFINVGCINFEPVGQNAAAPYIVRNRSSGNFMRIGYIRFSNGTADFVYLAESAPARFEFGPVQVNGGTLNNNVIDAQAVAGTQSWYWGTTADVTNNTGSGSTGIQCLDGAGTEA
ncbi:MAG: hypothetical protein ACNS61_05510 [Candidatus Wenzhouxiangella sp. M2_3B_020]